MIRPPRFIDVLPEDIDPKEEYQGYKKGEHSYSLCSITFDENLNPIRFGEYPLTDEEKEGITAYMRHMTWQEYIKSISWDYILTFIVLVMVVMKCGMVGLESIGENS